MFPGWLYLSCITTFSFCKILNFIATKHNKNMSLLQLVWIRMRKWTSINTYLHQLSRLEVTWSGLKLHIFKVSFLNLFKYTPEVWNKYAIQAFASTTLLLDIFCFFILKNTFQVLSKFTSCYMYLFGKGWLSHSTFGGAWTKK